MKLRKISGLMKELQVLVLISTVVHGYLSLSWFKFVVLGYLSLSWWFGPSLAWSDEKLQEAIKTTKAYWPSLKQMRKNRHGKRDSRVSGRRKIMFCTIDVGIGEHRCGWRHWTTRGSRQVKTFDKNMLIFITLWAWCMILDKTFSQIKNRSTWSDWKAVEMISSFSLIWSRALVARSSGYN